MASKGQAQTDKSTIVRLYSTFVRPALRAFSSLAPKAAASTAGHLLTKPMRFAAPARERVWTDGMEISRMKIEHEQFGEWDLRLASRGAGPTVVMVHGWSGRGSQLGAFVDPLVELGYRVSVLDLPAHGDSAGSRTTLPAVSAAIEAVVERLGGVRALIAHSMGAAATTLAVARGARVEKLVYFSSPNDVGSLLQGAGEEVGFSRSVVEEMRARFEKRIGFRFRDLVGSSVARDLDVPLLAFHDRDDRDVDVNEGRELVKAWRGARLVETAGLGHRRILRDAAVVSTAVNFVAAPVLVPLPYDRPMTRTMEAAV